MHDVTYIQIVMSFQKENNLSLLFRKKEVIGYIGFWWQQQMSLLFDDWVII